jgi:FtsH-binding integral membrane protein
MNAAHLHLVTSHAPIFGLFFGLVVWLWALLRRSQEVRRAALLLFVLSGLLAIPAFTSGSPAAKSVLNLPGVNRDAVDRHEEVAVLAFVATALLGCVALAGLVAFRLPKSLPRWFGAVTLGLVLLAGGLMTWASSIGGQTRHPEVRRTPQ